MRVAIFDHQRKSYMYLLALQAAGHDVVGDTGCDVLLVDYEGPEPIRGPLITACHEAGARIVLYPHGARPLIFRGLYDPDERVSAQLVPGQGHVDVYRAQGIERPMIVTGWSYSNWAPFMPKANVRRVLFAPIHPFGNGDSRPQDRADNLRAYRRLIEELPREVDLVVRMFGTFEQNGIYRDPRCFYSMSDLNLATADIDQADLVVAEDTFAYLAAARGKPVIMFAQNTPQTDDSGTHAVDCWDTVAPSFRYPYDLDDGLPLAVLIERACSGGPELVDWSARFIGGPFDQVAFVAALERLCAEVPVAV